ncbi:MAG: hypothetical protein ACYTGZ_06250 [Planctomycetota bacterium]|jgi:hypothetical protein
MRSENPKSGEGEGARPQDASVTQAIDNLVRRVRELRDELPADKQQIVAVDLECLIAEATSRTPRREYLEIATEGLRQVADPCSKPMLGAVEQVCSRLGIRH